MSRDSDKKMNNKKHREEIRNISSIENGTSRAYRQKVLVRQAGKLVDELERAMDAQGVKNRRLRQMESSDRR